MRSIYTPGKWYRYKDFYWVLLHENPRDILVSVDINDGDGWRWRTAHGTASLVDMSEPFDQPPEHILLSYMQWKIAEATRCAQN